MKQDKSLKIEEAFKKLKSAGLHWECFNNNLHWRVGGINFYPTTGRWHDPLQDFRGEGLDSFIKYIKARDYREKSSIKMLTPEQIFDIAKNSKDKSLMGICEAIHKGIYPC